MPRSLGSRTCQEAIKRSLSSIEGEKRRTGKNCKHADKEEPMYLSLLRIGDLKNPRPKHTPTKLGNASLDRIGQWGGRACNTKRGQLFALFPARSDCAVKELAKVPKSNPLPCKSDVRAEKQNHPLRTTACCRLFVPIQVSLSKWNCTTLLHDVGTPVDVSSGTPQFPVSSTHCTTCTPTSSARTRQGAGQNTLESDRS